MAISPEIASNANAPEGVLSAAPEGVLEENKLESNYASAGQQQDDKIEAEDGTSVGEDVEEPEYVFGNDVEIDTRQPQQNRFDLPGGIVVSSEFDSGNLGKCYPSECGTPDKFTCWMSGDGLPYTPKGHFHTWFYFNVRGA